MVETAGYSSTSSSSVNDHRPQSWPLRSFLVHAGIFCCFHILLFPNSDMDYRIFNLWMSSFCMRIDTGGGGGGGGGLCLQSHPKDFCEVCTEFDCGEISGRAQKLARNGHPSIWWPRWMENECSSSALLTRSPSATATDYSLKVFCTKV